MPRAPKKLYNMPEKIPEGTILTDKQKNSFRVGPSIGIGGFGEVYTAKRDGEKNFDYVVKCEPSENGPLFVEIHFYMRCGKETDIQSYKKKHGLKSLGMPHFVASGSVALNSKDHRFLVMPRYGRNIEHYFLANGKRLPVGTIYRLAIQMLNVYEYVHFCGYMHGDLKATNMLLGTGKNANAQAYLVDYGLAARVHIDKDFKPDPKKAHNGTMEFESRDCHLGVPTMRSDLEILGYNLLYWTGAELTWVRDKCLNVPSKVQAAKVHFMTNLDAEFKKMFSENTTAPLLEYLKYVNKLKPNEKPDYKKCCKIFQDALKALKISDTGDLDLEIKKTTTKKTSPVKVTTKRQARTKPNVVIEDSDEIDSLERNASDDDDDDVVFEPRTRKPIAKPGTLKTTKYSTPPIKKPETITNKISPSPVQRKRVSPRLAAANSTSPSPKRPKTTPPTGSSKKRSTPLTARANINFSPVISLSKKATSSTLSTRHGSTVINDNITPNPRSGKTYEFNFELDVSMDANVVVNVKRKKKTRTEETVDNSKATPNSSSKLSNGGSETPVKQVKVQKIFDDANESGEGPRTPVVKMKRVKRF